MLLPGDVTLVPARGSVTPELLGRLLDEQGGALALYAAQWTDAADDHSKGSHSKSHHQQYTDFIRSGLYKNATSLMTCASCHDPHQKTANPRQLRASPASNTGLCGSCHTAEAADLAATLVRSGDVVLVKGSRGIRTEVVVERLKAEFA